jgi:DNA-binding MarR family transcriptional regulator
VTENASRRDRRRTRPLAADRTRWADLADLALVISREIQLRGYTDERAQSLTPSEGVVMRHLLQGGPAAPNEIAAAVGLQRTNLSTTLRGLEHKGLVERAPDPDDGRRIAVTATDQGRLNYRVARQEWGTALAEAADHDTTHLDGALKLLTAVRDGLIRARS